ncbi:uncharacterized protein [Drosophila tropicalis]|uniref:uncharacterized protein n=1 Tax=Drosophila tropicalis TaxID=46794 RepID=UPI0035ABC218
MYAILVEKFSKLKKNVKWLFNLYELNTQIAICEPWEKVFCHTLFASCLSLLLYATFAVLPGYCLVLMTLLWPSSSNIIIDNNHVNTNTCSLSLQTLCPT